MGSAPSWSWREGVDLVPSWNWKGSVGWTLFGAGEEVCAGTLLKPERARDEVWTCPPPGDGELAFAEPSIGTGEYASASTLLELESRCGLNPLLEIDKRCRHGPLPELETKRGPALWSLRGCVGLAPSSSSKGSRG